MLTLFGPAAWAQTDDLAAERERLANQRIAAEARAREEQERQARLAAERDADAVPRQAAPAPAGETRSVVTAAPASSAQAAPLVEAPRESAQPPRDVERMLEQIRTLGELRDAGYVTDTEFERIKQRILDGTL